ncbi:hypothetical protein Q3G72_022966 [Acer saccharum]|nr:hypothetical protein Q3G72_022966 [Acer saccharum]
MELSLQHSMVMAAQETENEVGIQEEDDQEVKWVNHYSSNHQILLVGEGDFSFSLCLALAFGSASNICASSLDSYDTVIQNYKKAKSNLDTLEKLGAYVLHRVDATRMKLLPDLRMRKFDRIIFNFPHAGFLGKEDNPLVISMHRNLVYGFFKNAAQMLRADGEVHVSHKTTAPFHRWHLEELAIENSLLLIDSVDFKIEDYPSYNNKRGEGSRCDEPFPLGECSTFKFGFSGAAKKKFREINGFPNRRSLQLQRIHIQIQKQEASFDSRHSGIRMNEFPGHVGLPLVMNIQRESPRMFHGHFSNVSETFGRVANDVDYTIHNPLRFESFGHPQRNFTPETFGRAANEVDYTIHEPDPLPFQRHCGIRMNECPGHVGLPLATNIQRETPGMFHGHFSNVQETFGRTANYVDYTIHEPLRFECFGPHRFESFGHPQRNFTRNMNDLPGYMGLTLTSDIQRERLRIFDDHFKNVRETRGRVGDHVSYSVRGSYFSGLERCMEETPGRMSDGDLYVINELQRMNDQRRMRRMQRM